MSYPVENQLISWQRLRVDQVLGIVRDHDVEAHPVLGFVRPHAEVDLVEAVAFGRRPVVRADHHVDSLVYQGGLSLVAGSFR